MFLDIDMLLAKENGQSLALMTDFYQFTMAYGYFKKKLHKKEAVFSLFYRKNPFGGGYAVAAGLEAVIKAINNYSFSKDDISYLTSIKGADNKAIFDNDFLCYLASIRFSCSIDAVPEGTVVFPYEPILRAQGPLLECQLLESLLLNLINFPTLIATKSSRICMAAQGEPVLEFGLRRAHGVDGALTATRASFIGGCSSTSNTLAGKFYGIPVKGTHAHSWIMVHDDEFEAFLSYAEVMPSDSILLVDTYNTLAGVKKAAQVGQRLKNMGLSLYGIRLDSGDLGHLSIESRKILDASGLKETKIIASNDLDEHLIEKLKSKGAAISMWGVGTSLVTGQREGALGGVYKLCALKDDKGSWQYKIKLSEQMSKNSDPGILQTRRYFSDNKAAMDIVYDNLIGLGETPSAIDYLDGKKIEVPTKHTKSKNLLLPIFCQGKLVYKLPALSAIQKNTLLNLKQFHEGIKQIVNPDRYVVAMEKKTYDVKNSLIKKFGNNFKKNEDIS